MSRTAKQLVQDLLGDDYGARVDGTLPDLQQFIDSAASMVDQLVQLSASNQVIVRITLPSPTLELVERWLAAHFYVQSDQNYSSKSTGGASGSFQGQTGKGLEGSKYGLHAMKLDTTGVLGAIDQRKFAGGMSLGRRPDEQMTYRDRIND